MACICIANNSYAVVTRTVLTALVTSLFLNITSNIIQKYPPSISLGASVTTAGHRWILLHPDTEETHVVSCKNSIADL